MNTVYVSGTIKTPAQIKMNEKGYLLTFDMIQSDQSIDNQGTVKQVLTPWAVSLPYTQKPTQLLKQLDQGIKVLVKGNAKIDYKEVDEEFKLDCALQGEQLDIFEGQTKQSQLDTSAATEWQEPAAMAS